MFRTMFILDFFTFFCKIYSTPLSTTVFWQKSIFGSNFPCLLVGGMVLETSRVAPQYQDDIGMFVLVCMAHLLHYPSTTFYWEHQVAIIDKKWEWGESLSFQTMPFSYFFMFVLYRTGLHLFIEQTPCGIVVKLSNCIIHEYVIVFFCTCIVS